MRESLFKKLTRIIFRHHGVVVALVAVVSVLSLLGASRIRLIWDMLQMLPPTNLYVREYLDTMRRVHTGDYLVILLSGADRDTLVEFSDFLARDIQETGLVSEVRYKITEEEKDFLLTGYLPRIFLYLDEKEFSEIERKLIPEAIEDAVSLDKKILLASGSPEAARLIAADPLDFLSIVDDKLFTGEGGVRIRDASGHYFINGGAELLILARPVKEPSDFLFSKQLITRIKAIEKRIKSSGGFDDVIVEFTGNHAIIYYNILTVKRDLNMTTILAFTLVLLLFFLVFRRASVVCFVGTVLAVGILWTLGFVGLAIGHLTMVTASSGAILLGLGIDYSVHIYSRYLEEMNGGCSSQQAMETALEKTGPVILLGASTTAAAFFSLCFSRLKVLSDLGLIGGVGVIMIVCSTFIVFPMLIRAFPEKPGGGRRYHVLSFGTDRIGPFIIAHTRSVLAVVILISLVMTVMISRVGFVTDINALLPKDNPGLMVRNKIEAMVSGYLSTIIVTARGPDLDELLTITEKSEKVLSSYPEIAVVGGPSVLLPSMGRQEENIRKVRDIDIEKTIDCLHASLTAHGFAAERFSAFDDALRSYEDGGIRPVTYEEAVRTPAGAVIDRYVGREDGDWLVSVFAYPYAGLWEEGVDQGLVDRLKGISDAIRVTGFGMIMAETKRMAISDFFRAVFLAALATVLILSFRLRRIKPIIFCMLSLGLGVVWMIGFMGIMGISLNYATIGVAPMVIGIGIDNNIHLYYRFTEKDCGGVENALIYAGRAIVLCAATTIMGFGALCISDYPGLRSIGLLAALGIFFCMLTALLVLPSLMLIGSGKGDEGC